VTNGQSLIGHSENDLDADYIAGEVKCHGGAAGRTDHFGCLFNSFRTIVRGRVGTYASSSAIDRLTSFSERPSDAATLRRVSRPQRQRRRRRVIFLQPVDACARWTSEWTVEAVPPFVDLQLRIIAQLGDAHQ
jgi:hypothetical protein